VQEIPPHFAPLPAAPPKVVFWFRVYTGGMAALYVCCMLAAIVFALPFVLPRRPWVWVYDMVVICIGLTSCCIMPAALPLLIYWIKPEVKAWFQQG
jgi:hypothetical protein